MLDLFNPQGPIASGEIGLIKTEVLLMLIVVVPLLILFFIFARKYRAGNAKARRMSEAEQQQPHGAWRELALWAIPVALIAVLAVFSYRAAHALDPYKPITNGAGANQPPLTIQVIALPWKWLFIYPAQNIATVNFIQFPAGVPVHFELTADGPADAPMSSFWIPQLGSQIYAMAAMKTQLNLEAAAPGEFVGKDTEINGAGYAGMTFVAKASSQEDFDAWVAAIKARSVDSTFVNEALTADEYAKLAAPSENNPRAFYSAVEGGLFDDAIMKYMEPSTGSMDLMIR